MVLELTGSAQQRRAGFTFGKLQEQTMAVIDPFPAASRRR